MFFCSVYDITRINHHICTSLETSKVVLSNHFSWQMAKNENSITPERNFREFKESAIDHLRIVLIAIYTTSCLMSVIYALDEKL